jgi:hypothetical protein
MNKGVLAVLVVFFGFWMFTDPHSLAQFTQATGDSVSAWGDKLFTNLIAFLGDL